MTQRDTMTHSVPVSDTGTRLYPGFLSREAQVRLVAELRACVLSAPLFTPVMPRTGKAFTVRMTNLGKLGWVSDKDGYRYQACHPVTGKPWPDIPEALLSLWRAVTPSTSPPPDACLVNYYVGAARMGLHRDEDEKDFTVPVVSLSLGDDALFRLGGLNRRDKTKSFRLRSGDVLVLGGEDRLAYHGVDRVYLGTSTLLEQGGRLNLTMRRAE